MNKEEYESFWKELTEAEVVTLHDFEKRIDEFFDDIKEKYHDKSVLIVAHGGIAKVIKAHLYGMPESQNLAEISMNNCEIIETEI